MTGTFAGVVAAYGAIRRTARSGMGDPGDAGRVAALVEAVRAYAAAGGTDPAEELVAFFLDALSDGCPVRG